MTIELPTLAHSKARRALVLLAAIGSTPFVALESTLPVPSASETDDSEATVEIPDAALRKAVEEALGKDPGDRITRGEMATLRGLAQRGVRQLAGLEYAVNLSWLSSTSGGVEDLRPLSNLISLTQLVLSSNEIVDLSPLAYLTSLTDLWLGGNGIADVSSLAGMTALTRLDLGGNEIADVSSLAGKTALTGLYLYSNEIIDVSPLADLTSLTRLHLHNNEIVDVSPLADMTSLTSLNLGGNRVVDLSPLAGLTSLKDLDLPYNAISDVSPLAGMTALTALDLDGNAVSDTSALSGMTGLTYLDLGGNEVADVSPLAGMTALTDLDLQRNEIADVAPLASMTSLTRLDLGGNEIADVAPLAGMTALTRLHLDRNEVADVSPLAGMTSLTELWLGVNEIADVSPLAGMTSLTRLDLGGNEIADVAPLAGMTSLKELWLGGNEIADVSPLADMTALTTLGLGGNEIADVSPLADMTSLTRLYLGYNEIADVSPLAGMTSLTYLSLASNEIADVSPLADMTSLTYLSLASNEIADVSPLAGMTSLTWLNLARNRVADVSPLAGLTALTNLNLGTNWNLGTPPLDVSPLVMNSGLGPGDVVDLRQNLLAVESRETHIPTLLQRGVEVLLDDVVNDLPEIPDVALRQVAEWALIGYRSWLSKGFATLATLDASSQGVEDLTGLEMAQGLRGLFLDRNKIVDISPLAGLGSLRVLTLARNSVEDWSPLAGMDSLYFLALDGNSLCELPPLPSSLWSLYLTDNCLSDIDSLADIRNLVRLDVGGNSITSLAPLAGIRRLAYLHVHDNQVADVSSLNFQPLRELHIRNNVVSDISPLLNAERLLMVDVRRNPLADEALGVLDTLRERNVTVLAGEAVPYFPAAGDVRQGFVRIVNRSGEAGHVFIEAVDDAGVRAGRVRMEIGVRRAVHFNSGDLENGNAGKGLSGGIGAPTSGDWRLSVISALDVEVLSYIRTEDGFVTAMHDVAAEAMVPFFNPGSNDRQRSILRVVNTEAEPAKWTTGGYDDHGQWSPMAGSLLVRPQRTLTLTARALEDDHGLGDGHGKWRLRTRGFPWYAMSLLESPTGHLTNLSTAPDNATALADGRTLHRLPLFPAAGGSRQGFVRVINRSYSSGEVVIEAVDDAGVRSAPVRLTLRPRRVAHFNSMDLEVGNADKGLDGGVGVGRGDWRLEVTSKLDLMVLSYARTADGFLTSLHDLAPVAADGGHRVVFFNPGRNTRQVSKLRLINDGERAASATITGIDDHGNASGPVAVTVPAGSALTFTASELEAGEDDRVAGGLGNPAGKWRLRVRSEEPIAVMSLLETPTGHLTNVSTGTAD